MVGRARQPEDSNPISLSFYPGGVGVNFRFLVDRRTETAGEFGVTCTRPDGRGADTSLSHLGNASDRFSGTSKGGSTMTVYGNGGDDRIFANGGSSYAYGGTGADTLTVSSNGLATALGGPGADHIMGVRETQTLAGEEGDDLVVSAGGSGFRNQITGDGGHDDMILSTKKGDAWGGGGADTMVVRPMGTSSGDWTLDGGAGNDTIVNGPNVGAVSGGAGDDVIDTSAARSSDGVMVSGNTVDCGAGTDTVYTASDDVLASTCEIRREGPMPASQAVEAALARYAEAFPPGA